MKKEKLCPDCKERFCKLNKGNWFSARCIPCSFIYDKNRYKENKNEEKLIEISCKKCNNIFTGKSNRKYCSDQCKPGFKTESQKWIDAKPKTSNGMHSTQVAYSFFRKKYGVKSKYKACRG